MRAAHRARLPVSVAILVITVAASGFSTVVHWTFTGRCVGITDGDTISVMRDGKAVSVRLEGIDAPEPGQDFSNRAKQMASILAYGKDVAVEVWGTDKHGRTLGRVTAEGLEVNLELVRAGLAWHYKEYSNDPVLAAAERDARNNRRGLWVVARPMPPWEYRASGIRPPPVREGVVVRPTPAPRREQPSGIVYHGNRRSRIFHRPGCQHYWCSNCVVEFTSKEAAVRAGYRGCRVCWP